MARITDDEKVRINQLQQSYNQKIMLLGDNQYQKVLLETKLADLKLEETSLIEDLTITRASEDKLIKELSVKYGDLDKINFTTGEISE